MFETFAMGYIWGIFKLKGSQSSEVLYTGFQSLKVICYLLKFMKKQQKISFTPRISFVCFWSEAPVAG